MKKVKKNVVAWWSISTSSSDRVYDERFSCLSFLLCFFLLFGGSLLVNSPAHAEIKSGDILVVDQIGGTNGLGALFLVNPKTGRRVVHSDFGNPAQGPLGSAIVSVAVGAGGQVFVSDLFAGGSGLGGAIFEVDPITGNRTIISDFGQGDILGFLYYGLVVDDKDRLIANLQGYSPAGIVRVDPETDTRVVISDLSNAAQGAALSPNSLADLSKERSGNILLSALIYNKNNTTHTSAIFRVNPKTGNRQLLSDFANPSQGTVGDLGFSTGLAVEASGKILVAASGSGNLLFRIHPRTGRRAVLSDFDNPLQGALGINLYGIAIEESGKIIISSVNPAIGSFYANLLFRVNPNTGERTLLSDSENPAQGPSFLVPTYIAIVPNVRHANGHEHNNAESRY
ncbi:MAG: hypothetical protein ABL925_05765 [Methylococcales bacterium]